MISALLIDDCTDEGSLAAAISLLRATELIGEVLIATDRDLDLNIDSTAVSIKRESTAEAFLDAIKKSENERLIVMSTALTMSDVDMAAFLGQADQLPKANHLFVPFTTQGDMAELPTFSPEGLIESIRRGSQWQLLCVATTRSQLSSTNAIEATSVTEILVRTFITAYGQGDAVEPTNCTGTVESEGISDSLCTLDDGELCRVLKTAIDSFNIEELFPALAWRDFSSESAAAAYHSLAALFIRVGDLESANQCLGHSEQLEESPRYFALKGLIARERGETLGAVANMVSSLQCYEARKRRTDEHYLVFEPTDLEDINSQLVEGLNALNRRDNETALAHFSRAVFKFDPFYVELGVRSRPS